MGGGRIYKEGNTGVTPTVIRGQTSVLLRPHRQRRSRRTPVLPPRAAFGMFHVVGGYKQTTIMHHLNQAEAAAAAAAVVAAALYQCYFGRRRPD